MHKQSPLIPARISNALLGVILGSMLIVASPILIPALAIGFLGEWGLRRFSVPYENEYSTWYAWRPVKTWTGYWVWLETIERRRLSRFDAFYQLVGDERP